MVSDSKPTKNLACKELDAAVILTYHEFYWVDWGTVHSMLTAVPKDVSSLVGMQKGMGDCGHK
jgi:hypothetical protein